MKIPGYNIERQIGKGGMAVVYRAIQESLGRPVALADGTLTAAQAPMDVQPPLDTPASTSMLVVADTQTLADPQVPIGAQAEVTLQPPIDRPGPLDSPAPIAPSVSTSRRRLTARHMMTQALEAVETLLIDANVRDTRRQAAFLGEQR
jgi:hypothetical protein